MLRRFEIGDRVARRETPDDCGSVLKVLSEGPAGERLLLIDWDDRPISPLAEAALTHCGAPSS